MVPSSEGGTRCPQCPWGHMCGEFVTASALARGRFVLASGVPGVGVSGTGSAQGSAALTPPSSFLQEVLE